MTRSDLRGGRVLVVDDEEGVRTYLAEALERAGHDVTQAADGSAALRLARVEPFDVVLTDLRMPEIDGMTVVRTIRTEQPDVEVIVLTAFGEVSTAVEHPSIRRRQPPTCRRAARYRSADTLRKAKALRPSRLIGPSRCVHRWALTA